MKTLFSKVRSLWRDVAASKIVSPEEIEGALHLPVLAIIPHIERRRSKEHTAGSKSRKVDLEGRWRSRLMVHFPEKSQASLAYQSLVSDLHQRSREQRQKVWLLASGVAGEGTSISCINLAITAQKRRIKTLIIEGHTRSPRISRVLRLNLEPGLIGCLQRSLSLAHAVRQSSVAAGVHVLPAGRSIAYPEMLWPTPAFHRLLAEARSVYDLVLFEGPPALLYPDVSVLADKVDGVVLVHQFGRTPPERVQRVIEKLGERQSRLLGVLLNDVPAN